MTSRSSSGGISLLIVAIITFILVAAMGFAGCTGKTNTVLGTSPVTAGAYLATVSVTDFTDPANPVTSSYPNTSFWIMQDGPGVSYWGALGKEMSDRIVIDSKVENSPDPYVEGIFESFSYSGSATSSSGHLSFRTTYFTGDGSLLAGPTRMDYDVSNMTGPISLPFSTPTPAAMMAQDEPKVPVKDFSMNGMRHQNVWTSIYHRQANK